MSTYRLPDEKKKQRTFGDLLKEIDKLHPEPWTYADWYCPELPRKYKGRNTKYGTPFERKLAHEENKHPYSIREWVEAPDGAMDVYRELGRRWAAGERIAVEDVPAHLRKWLKCPGPLAPSIGLISVQPDGEVILLDDRRKDDKPKPPGGFGGEMPPSMPAKVLKTAERALTRLDPSITADGIRKALEGFGATPDIRAAVEDATAGVRYSVPSVEAVRKSRQRDPEQRLVRRPQVYRHIRGDMRTAPLWVVTPVPSRTCGVCGEEMAAERISRVFCSSTCRKRASRTQS